MIRLTRETKLAPAKSLSSFSYSDVKSIQKTQVDYLIQDRQWVHQANNLLLFGPSGVGKTHLAAAVRYALIEHNIQVKFMTATALVQVLQKARDELGLTDALNRLDKYAVLILDDIGYVKKNDMESQVLFKPILCVMIWKASLNA